MLPDCIIWPLSKFRNGYGKAWHDGKSVGAHRVAWEKAYGPIPAGMCVLHRCDNPPCINVKHFFLGTVADNNADRLAKGRYGVGTRNGRALVSEQTAIRLKMLYGVLSPYKLIGALPISRSQMDNIQAGRLWKHVTAMTRYGP